MATGLALLAPTALMAQEEKAAEAKAEAKKADVEVVVTGNDQMQYDKKEFTVTEGETVALTFKNIGKLPKIAMGHNLVILEPGTNSMQFAMAGMANKDTTGLPDDEEKLKAVVAATKILGPDEEETVTFTAPAPGKYEYVCTFPGHAAVMKGVMTVEAK